MGAPRQDALTSLAREFGFGLKLYQVLVPNELCLDHRVGGQHRSETLTVNAGCRFPVLDVAEVDTGAHHVVERGTERPQGALELVDNDVELRRHALQVLEAILEGTVAFDPFAPEAQRRQQLAALRDGMERKAG